MSTSSGKKGKSFWDSLTSPFKKKQTDETESESRNSPMNPYLYEKSNVYAENKLLRNLFIGILVVVIYNTYQIDNLKTQQTTHLIPAGYSVEYTFTGNLPSENYLRDMGLFIMQMVGDLSSGSARRQFEDLMTLWHPSTSSEYIERFRKITQEIEKYPSTTYDVTWEASKPIIFLPGEIKIAANKRKIVGSRITATTTLEYKIQYTVENGRFNILHVKEIGGDEI